nr:Flp family type IVb pilin [Altererythrobacter xiamenensis]
MYSGDHRRPTVLKLFARDETGATAIEYALIASLIAVAAIVSMNSLGNEITSSFSNASNEMSEANAGI